MDRNSARRIEHDKYAHAYNSERYRMGGTRKGDALRDLRALPSRGSYLDVSCGRGEMLDLAEALGFDRVAGTEIVETLVQGDVVYAEAHELPFGDGEFEVVSLFDVIEHLLPGDDELACRELLRVASCHILLTANNKPSRSTQGDDLHINIRSYSEWHELFCDWFEGCMVTWLSNGGGIVSETWRIDLPAAAVSDDE